MAYHYESTILPSMIIQEQRRTFFAKSPLCLVMHFYLCTDIITS